MRWPVWDAKHGSKFHTSGCISTTIIFNVMFKELKEKYDELESSSQASDDNLVYIEIEAEEIMDRFQF